MGEKQYYQEIKSLKIVEISRLFVWRRERDSNPCVGVTHLPVFKTGPFNHLGISPYRELKTAANPIVRGGVAQKERFELSRCSSHPTPLAGEPLRPLGYFCKPK